MNSQTFLFILHTFLISSALRMELCLSTSLATGRREATAVIRPTVPGSQIQPTEQKEKLNIKNFQKCA